MTKEPTRENLSEMMLDACDVMADMAETDAEAADYANLKWRLRKLLLNPRVGAKVEDVLWCMVSGPLSDVVRG